MENTLEEKKERINKAYEILYDKEIVKSRREFGELLNRNAPNITKAMNGNPNYLTDKFLAKSAERLAKYINSRWLRFGEGSWEPCACESSFTQEEINENQRKAIENLTNEVEKIKELCNNILQALNK